MLANSVSKSLQELGEPDFYRSGLGLTSEETSKCSVEGFGGNSGFLNNVVLRCHSYSLAYFCILIISAATMLLTRLLSICP